MNYKTVYQGASAEIVEKKSRFIADVFPVSSAEEATEYLEKVKKQYWDARHHCWAYVIGVENVQERCSDDGEPKRNRRQAHSRGYKGTGPAQCADCRHQILWRHAAWNRGAGEGIHSSIAGRPVSQ